MNFKKYTLKLIFFTAAIIFTGCGGGSSDNSNEINIGTDRPTFNRALASRAPIFQPSGNITDTRPSFTWVAIPNATDYRLGYEDTDTETNWIERTETSSFANCADTCTLSFVDDSLIVGDEKVWWVRAKVAGVWQDWSTAHIFKIIELPDNDKSIPSPIMPEGMITDFTPEFSWTSVAQATGYQFGYENPNDESDWQEYTPSSFELSCSRETLICSYTPQFPNLFAGDNKRWWIRANINGVWGEWSQSKDFNLPEAETNERPFVLKVKPYRPQQSSESVTNFIINTNPNYSYNYNVDCNSDGILEAENIISAYTCEYPDSYPNFNEYKVSISGKFPALYQREINSVQLATPKMIIGVEQWGSQVWQSMWRAFTNTNLKYFPQNEIPNMSQVVSMREMFSNSGFPQSIAQGSKTLALWDVGNVTNMNRMFLRFSNSEIITIPDISNWNVSNVKNMDFMFRGNTNFNIDISQWDVSKVVSMNSVFALTNFNQDIGNWNVSNVTSMIGVFNGARNFNQDISTWDVSNVSSMSNMFSNAKAFNQDISAWKVSKVFDMIRMFANATSFNQDLSNWDISKVDEMREMFESVTLSPSNYSSMLNAWSNLPLISNNVFDGGNSKYNASALSARNRLTNEFGWIISDGGLL